MSSEAQSFDQSQRITELSHRVTKLEGVVDVIYREVKSCTPYIEELKTVALNDLADEKNVDAQNKVHFVVSKIDKLLAWVDAL